MRPSVEERFWARVRESDSCWEWTGNCDRGGYGRISIDGKSRAAHRLSYELNVGPIPGDLFVCHHCDNPPCVRPDHLFVGTNADNIRDAVAKGRIQPDVMHAAIRERRNGNRGSRNPAAKLTETRIREIRARYEAGGVSQRVLAREYGVSKAAISHAVTQRTWRKRDGAING